MQKNGTTRTLHTVKDVDGAVTSRVRRTVLPSGLRVVTEQMVGTRSASIGVWVNVGSRDETPALHGCSHFLEHLLFKGTRERSALDISVALDAVGGEFNAFTAKEYTCFHARVLDDDLPLAVDVIGDMITNSLITAADVLIALALANYGAKSAAKTQLLEQQGVLALAQITGITETGTRSRGSTRWRTCQSSEYLSPIRARSGPVRFEPQSIG